jgi:hypothetical protein
MRQEPICKSCIHNAGEICRFNLDRYMKKLRCFNYKKKAGVENVDN